MKRIGDNLATFQNWPQEVIRMSFPVLLVRHFDPGALATIRQARPKITFIARPFGGDDFDWRHKPASEYAARILDQKAAYPFIQAWEGPNEPNPGKPEIDQFLNWNRSLLFLANQHGFYIAFGALSPQNYVYDGSQPAGSPQEWTSTRLWRRAQDIVNHPRVRFITVHADIKPGHPGGIPAIRSILPVTADKIIVATELTVDRSSADPNGDGHNEFPRRGWKAFMDPATVLAWLKDWDAQAKAIGRLWGTWFTDSTGEGKWDDHQRQGTDLQGLWLPEEPDYISLAPPSPAPQPPSPPLTPGPASFIDVVDLLPKHPTLRYTTRNLADISYIVWHHAAGNSAPQGVAKMHIQKGKPGIGYALYIMPDGRIYLVNQLTTVAWHAADEVKVGGISAPNLNGIGVCLDGDLTKKPPIEAQLQACKTVTALLEKTLGKRLGHNPHQAFQATSCPGRWDLILKAVAN